MLSLTDLTVRRGGRVILDGVSFTLAPGRLTALVGRNGSGKSTLLGCVGQQLPYGGAITLEGRDISALPPRERARRIAILPQQLGAPYITVREMAAFGRSPYLDFTGRLTAEDQAIVAESLREAEVSDLADRYVDSLSGGERQRAALAMLLAQRTPVALLDEPTAHMDGAHEAAFLRRLAAMSREGKAILIVLHDLSAAVHYADDLVVLEGGKAAFAGPREDCLRHGVLEQVFHLRRYEDQGRVFFAAD